MLFAYDLDGVLADTREAVLLSYRQAGVEPPPDFWGKPWRSWLKDERLHSEKNKYFYDNRFKIKPLPMLDLLKQTGGIILTGASRRGAAITLNALKYQNWEMDFNVFPELTAEGKAKILNEQAETGIIFEDTIENINIIRSTTKWKAVHVDQF